MGREEGIKTLQGKWVQIFGVLLGSVLFCCGSLWVRDRYFLGDLFFCVGFGCVFVLCSCTIIFIKT